MVVRKNRKTLVINKNGQNLLPVDCDEFYSAQDGMMWIKTTETNLWGAVSITC
jgi:hypothetical protein